MPSQWVARQELPWGAHQLGAHSLCEGTAIGQGACPSYWGDSFFRAVSNYIPSFTGLAPQMLEDRPRDVRVVFGWTPIEASRAIATLDLRATSE